MKQNMDVHAHAVNKIIYQGTNVFIFMKKNYDFTNEYVNTKLLKRYRDRNNKEFISKKCHENLKYGAAKSIK